MGLILRFRCRPPPLGSRIATAVDLHGGLIGGHVDVLVLNHDALFASGAVAFQRFELRCVGPQQLGRPVHDLS